MTAEPDYIDLTMTEETTSGDVFWPLLGLAGCTGIWIVYAPRNLFLMLMTVALAAMTLVNFYRFRRGPLRHRLTVSRTGIYESRTCKEEIPWADIESLHAGATLNLLCWDRKRFANDTWKDRLRNRLWHLLPARRTRPIDIQTRDYLGVDQERSRLVPLILKYHPPSRSASMNPTPPGML